MQGGHAQDSWEYQLEGHSKHIKKKSSVAAIMPHNLPFLALFSWTI